MRKISPQTLRSIIYILMTLLPAVLTGNIYDGVTSEKFSTNSKTSINAVGNTIYHLLQESTTNLSYTLLLLSHTYQFRTLNISLISEAINLYHFYNPNVCSNIFILNENNEVIFGVNNNQLSGVTHTEHIQVAFSGSNGVFYTNDPSPFAQLTYPIFSYDDPDKVIAVMVATIDLDYFKETLSVITDIGSDYTGYLLDSEGLVVVCSDPTLSSSKKLYFDIEQINYALTYSEDSTFTDFEGNTAYGALFEIKHIGSTLLVTLDAKDSKPNLSDYIGYILGLLGAGTITTAEVIRKKKSPFSSSSITNDIETDLTVYDHLTKSPND